MTKIAKEANKVLCIATKVLHMAVVVKKVSDPLTSTPWRFAAVGVCACGIYLAERLYDCIDDIIEIVALKKRQSKK